MTIKNKIIKPSLQTIDTNIHETIQTCEFIVSKCDRKQALVECNIGNLEERIKLLHNEVAELERIRANAFAKSIALQSMISDK